MFSACVENETGLMFVSTCLVAKCQGSRLPNSIPVGPKGTLSPGDETDLLKEQRREGEFPFRVLGPGPLLAPHPPMPGEAWAPGIFGHSPGPFVLLRDTAHTRSRLSNGPGLPSVQSFLS